MSTTQDTTLDRVRDLQDYIARGAILEAMDEFYAENAIMQENEEPPIVGRAANIEREKEFLAMVKEWQSFEVVAIAVHGDVSFVESTMDFITQDGTKVHTAQVSRARWEGGRIVDERFYHG